MDWEKDWIANAYAGMSRRQFLAQMTAAGAAVAGFAVASKAVAGEIISPPAKGSRLPSRRSHPGASGCPRTRHVRPARGATRWCSSSRRSGACTNTSRTSCADSRAVGFSPSHSSPTRARAVCCSWPTSAAVLKVANSVPDARVMADLDAIVAHVKTLGQARPDRIGITGFCRGGLYALLFAAHSPDIKAVVSWYGQLKPAKTAGIRTAGPLDLAARITGAGPGALRRGGCGHTDC